MTGEWPEEFGPDIGELTIRIKDGWSEVAAGVDANENPGLRWVAALIMATLEWHEVEQGTRPVNYLTSNMTLHAQGQDYRIAFEVLRPGGKSAHDLRLEAEARAAAAEAEVARLNQILDALAADTRRIAYGDSWGWEPI